MSTGVCVCACVRACVRACVCGHFMVDPSSRSFTTFKYSGLQVPSTISTKSDLVVKVTVENTGAHDGDEVSEK